MTETRNVVLCPQCCTCRNSPRSTVRCGDRRCVPVVSVLPCGPHGPLWSPWSPWFPVVSVVPRGPRGPRGPCSCCSWLSPCGELCFAHHLRTGGSGPADATSWSAQAALPEHHRWGCLQDRHLFLPVLEAGGPRLGCHSSGVLVRALSWLADSRLLAVSSCGRAREGGERQSGRAPWWLLS